MKGGTVDEARGRKAIGYMVFRRAGRKSYRSRIHIQKWVDTDTGEARKARGYRVQREKKPCI